ncbi:peptidase S8 and S53 subtilisin kexin sedolisin (plasmid) [Methylobacterium nodulans ORS 2060]|uniref:Peptidase S8 and S53 subtilisin kexin sedolisin n=2 Tax=Methylobacterium nodulans TaxID=114616 RepID=B8IVS1_METNO|nr:peptidase S8 and S53 subtilisin kexin sedolisin [Methylobacterium nodulans ORS 2060]
MYWLPLTPHRPATEILGLCVYDASGDVAGAPRSAFPTNTAQFRLSYGEAFTDLLIGETNKARMARGLNPASIVYKGYDIFQYDLQYVRTDEGFFRERKWYNFKECVNRAVSELTKKVQITGDIQDAVRAYNGSGPKAQQYARDVMRLLPYCEEAAATAVTPAVAFSGAGAGLSFVAFEESGIAADEDDPGAPGNSDTNETADFETARFLANLGAPGASDDASLDSPTFAAIGAINLDISRA